MKIRHYGFLASRNKPDLKMHQMQIGVLLETLQTKADKQGEGVSISQNSYRCPFCKTGTMIRILSFDANAPPEVYKTKPEIKVEIQK